MAAPLQPWYFAHVVDASLRAMPLALLVYLSAGLMIYGAMGGSFGIAVVGAMATVAAATLPVMLVPAIDRHAPGSGAVGIDVASAPGGSW